MKSVLAALMIVLTNPAFAADLGYDQAKGYADRDEASLSPELSHKLVQSQGAAMGVVLPACMASIPHPNGHTDLTPFVVVMQLDASGKVVRTWRHGGTPLANCFERGIGPRSLFVPHKAPFFTSIELALTEKNSGR